MIWSALPSTRHVQKVRICIRNLWKPLNTFGARLNFRHKIKIKEKNNYIFTDWPDFTSNFLVTTTHFSPWFWQFMRVQILFCCNSRVLRFYRYPNISGSEMISEDLGTKTLSRMLHEKLVIEIPYILLFQQIYKFEKKTNFLIPFQQNEW